MSEKIITEFYTAFQNRDAARVGALYHDDATFTDPAFGTLNAADARLMWASLIARADESMEIRFSNIEIKGDIGTANWEADYNFSKTKRFVRNKIRATMRFKNGKIISHVDEFNLWKWAHMALGPVGTFLGWTSFLRKKIQTLALKGLHASK